MFSWIKKALLDDVPEDFGAKPYVSAFRADAAEPTTPEPKKRGPYPKTPEDLKAAYAAIEAWNAKANRAVKTYKPKGPAFKIVQANAGHYEIHRRKIQRATGVLMTYGDSGLYVTLRPNTPRWVDEIEGQSVKPSEYYEPVRNDKAPIYQTRSPHGNLWDRDRLTGYEVLAFNVFDDAEAYLKRMTRKQVKEVGYDYPPLKRRVAPAKKRVRAQ